MIWVSSQNIRGMTLEGKRKEQWPVPRNLLGLQYKARCRRVASRLASCSSLYHWYSLEMSQPRPDMQESESQAGGRPQQLQWPRQDTPRTKSISDVEKFSIYIDLWQWSCFSYYIDREQIVWCNDNSRGMHRNTSSHFTRDLDFEALFESYLPSASCQLRKYRHKNVAYLTGKRSGIWCQITSWSVSIAHTSCAIAWTAVRTSPKLMVSDGYLVLWICGIGKCNAYTKVATMWLFLVGYSLLPWQLHGLLWHGWVSEDYPHRSGNG